jgi:hypothetical protein
MTLFPEDYNPEFPFYCFGRLLTYARPPLNAIVAAGRRLFGVMVGRLAALPVPAG